MALQGTLILNALAVIASIPAVLSAPTQHFERQVSAVPSFVLQYGERRAQLLVPDLDG